MVRKELYPEYYHDPDLAEHHKLHVGTLESRTQLGLLTAEITSRALSRLHTSEHPVQCRYDANRTVLR